MILKKNMIVICIITTQLIFNSDLTGTTTRSRKKMETNGQYQIKNSHSKYDISLDQLKKTFDEIKSMSRIIAQQSAFEKEKKILGDIEYTYPKDPKKEIELAFFDAPLTGHIGSFNRISGKHPWHEGGMIIFSDQMPYTMGITQYFFSEALGLIFDKAVISKNQEKNHPPNHVFYFHKYIGDFQLQYIFETRSDTSNLKDGYPKSFHRVRIYNTSILKE